MHYTFEAELWRSPGAAGWHFLTLPVGLSAQIKSIAGGLMNAFGSVRVTAAIGDASWKTSLFMDTKRGAFLLPVKAEIRRAAKIAQGDRVSVHLEIEL